MDLTLMEANRVGAQIIRKMSEELGDIAAQAEKEKRRHEQAMAKINAEAERLRQEGEYIQERGERNKASDILEQEYTAHKDELAQAYNKRKTKKDYLEIIERRNKKNTRKYKSIVNMQHKIHRDLQQTLCKINTATIRSCNRTIEQLDNKQADTVSATLTTATSTGNSIKG